MGRRGSFMAQSLLTKGAKEFDQRNARFPLQATEEELPLKGVAVVERREKECTLLGGSPKFAQQTKGGSTLIMLPPVINPFWNPYMSFLGGVGVVVWLVMNSRGAGIAIQGEFFRGLNDSTNNESKAVLIAARRWTPFQNSTKKYTKRSVLCGFSKKTCSIAQKTTFSGIFKVSISLRKLVTPWFHHHRNSIWSDNLSKKNGDTVRFSATSKFLLDFSFWMSKSIKIPWLVLPYVALGTCKNWWTFSLLKIEFNQW